MEMPTEAESEVRVLIECRKCYNSLKIWDICHNDGFSTTTAKIAVIWFYEQRPLMAVVISPIFLVISCIL